MANTLAVPCRTNALATKLAAWLKANTQFTDIPGVAVTGRTVTVTVASERVARDLAKTVVKKGFAHDGAMATALYTYLGH